MNHFGSQNCMKPRQREFKKKNVFNEVDSLMLIVDWIGSYISYDVLILTYWWSFSLHYNQAKSYYKHRASPTSMLLPTFQIWICIYPSIFTNPTTHWLLIEMYCIFQVCVVYTYYWVDACSVCMDQSHWSMLMF